MSSNDANFKDRARAAFLGLALGDAYGRPLEFIRDERVRTAPVIISPGQFHWTDDTHMALYLGKAILDIPPTKLDRDQFGAAVGRRFVEWLHDPLTPRTAPGRTCLAGAENFERDGKWAQAGILGSDGCGAVMRICPLAIAFDGRALIDAADISARVTHRHPNASAAAIAATFILRKILQTGRFSETTVDDADGILAAHADPRQSVSLASNAGIVLASRNDQWLDESAVPEGDGGWRCSSALGLAIAAALRWKDGFETIVDRAARIHGDSDSVACLAGMFAAAAGGLESLPKAWLEALPQRVEIESLASALSDRPAIEFVSTASQ